MVPFPLFFVLLVATLTLILGTAVARQRARTRTQRIVTRGREMIEQGRLEEAVLYLDELIRGASPVPEREEGLFLLGRTLERLGRKLEAQRAYMLYLGDYEHRGADSERLAIVNQRLGTMLVNVDDLSPWKKFIQQREDEIATPESRMFGLKDGRHMLELGRFDEALPVLRRLVRHPDPAAPSREAALLYLALTYEGMHQPGDAIETYVRYVSEYLEVPEVSHDPEIRAIVEARLRSLTEDGTSAERIPWEVFREELSGVRERVPLRELEEAEAVERAGPEPVARLPLDEEELRRDLLRLDAGHRVGRYVLADKLGEGGFGEVFRALLPVAIKFARTPEAVDRLRRFADLQAKVASERIVKPIEINLESDPPHIVMEFVDGSTLRDLLRRGRLEPALALPLFHEVALGLADAHRAGVAHLDLKPENVLLDSTGAVKLTDFDLGTVEADDQLQASLSFDSETVPQGTLVYMSPEQRAGEPANTRSDVYTFGVCLFEALTGTLPQPGDKPSDFVEGLSPEVDQVFERCFARQERRYADAAELSADLERALASIPARLDIGEVVARLPRREVQEAIPRALVALAEARERENAHELEQPEPAPEPEPKPESAPETESARPDLDDVVRTTEPDPAPRADLDALIAARAESARRKEEALAEETEAEDSDRGFPEAELGQ